MSRAADIHDARVMDDAELRINAEGCTEQTCVYHGVFNTVLRERGLR